jgi:hypothetical protein
LRPCRNWPTLSLRPFGELGGAIRGGMNSKLLFAKLQTLRFFDFDGLGF